MENTDKMPEFIKTLIEERDKIEAKVTISKLKALITLAENNDLACTVSICGISISLSVNSTIVPVLEQEIVEINNFLEDKQSNY